MRKTHLVFGNKKIPKTWASFNLPPIVTCPGATEECKTYCYALHSSYYPSVKERLDVNYKLTQSPEFVKTITEELEKEDVKVCRVHGSGDFYSQEYYDKWEEIADSFKDTVFYGYTKNINLRRIRGISKIVLRFSLDKSNMFAWRLTGQFDNLAFVLTKEEHPYDYCDPESDSMCVCRMRCGPCKACLETSGNIFFLRR